MKMRYSVIPVKKRIKSFQYLGRFSIPACAGMTTFCGFIGIEFGEKGCINGKYLAKIKKINNIIVLTNYKIFSPTGVDMVER
jgi:hypothetical protein